MPVMQPQIQPIFGVILIQQFQLISVNYAATLSSNAKVENQVRESVTNS